MMHPSSFLIFAYLIFTLMRVSQATEGVLPRGKMSAPGHKMIVPSLPPAAMRENIECTSYIANPEAGELFFSSDSKSVYFLSREPGDATAMRKSVLIEVDLDAAKSKRIVSLRSGEATALIGHGQPLEAITILDFQRVKTGCGEGFSSGVGIKWVGSQRILKTYPVSNYKIIPSDQGLLLADMDAKAIRTMDINTLQKKTLASIADKQWPLYLRVNPWRLLSFQPDSLELLRYEEQDPEPRAVLKLKTGMRLVQQDDQFGIVTASSDGKILQVKQIKAWSGDAFRGLDIKLPDGFLADKVGVATDFRSGLTLVFGASAAARREMRQVFISGWVKSQQEQIIKATEGQYFSHAVLTPKNNKILLLSRNLKDESVQSLRVGDPVSGEWREISIGLVPSADKPIEKPIEKVEIKSGETMMPAKE